MSYILFQDSPLQAMTPSMRHPKATRAQPGTILASRDTPNPIAAFGLIPIPLAGAYQLLYTSTDSFGKATATVTTVLVPIDADPTKLLSYQIAQDSSYLNCAPSYALQLFSESGGLLGTIGSQAEILSISGALAQGWIVAVPDHEGPPAAFLANIRGGQAVLDGIRAVLASTDIMGVDSSPTITIWGYSGGSLVSAFAAELRSTYAPELSIAGVALGGAVPNITSALPLINKSVFSGLIPPGILGLSHEYTDLVPLLDEYLVPFLEPAFRPADSQCLGADTIQFLLQDIPGTYFTDPSILYTNPEILAVQDANRLGQNPIDIPVFMYKAVNDEISAIADTDALFDYYCTAGAPSITYHRDLTAEHAILLITGAPDALEWLVPIMNGETPAAGCSSTDVISTLTDGPASELLGDEIVDILNELLALSVEELVL